MLAGVSHAMMNSALVMWPSPFLSIQPKTSFMSSLESPPAPTSSGAVRGRAPSRGAVLFDCSSCVLGTTGAGLTTAGAGLGARISCCDAGISCALSISSRACDGLYGATAEAWSRSPNSTN